MSGRLAGKRVVVTEADRFMGPALTKGLAEAGADVVADTRDQRHREAAKATIAEAGRVDALIANLGAINPRKSVVDTSDPEWAENVRCDGAPASPTVSRRPAANDCAAKRKDTGHGQRLDAARDAELVGLQLGARRIARLHARGGGRGCAPQRAD